MRINHNISALNTYRQLSANNTSTSKSLEKLSSGLRINRAGDDAAGLAISEKMRGQIRGLNQASSNANDGISLIQTAEGALSETHSILQRMRELAVQSSNDTNTADDRAEMQKEITQLKSEVDRISTSTEFNTRKLLNGQSGSKVIWQNNASLTNASVTESTPAGTLAINVTTDATQATRTATGAAVKGALVGPQSVTIGSNVINFDAGTDDATFAANFASAVNSANIGITAGNSSGTITLTASEYGTNGNFTIVANAASAALNLTADATTNYTATGVNIAGTIGTAAATGSGLTLTGTAAANMGAAVTLSAAAGTGANGSITVTQNALTMQIGANKDQSMTVNIAAMGVADLNITGVDVSSQTGATNAIDTLDSAIKSVSSERSKLGAYQNRLEHTINNLGTTSENLTASESRIRDVDMAKEMMEFTKNNILSQAAQAMLAQANQQPQSVLQLLQ